MTEWYDHKIDQMKRFRLSFFPYNDTIELYDLDFKKLCLRRTRCDTISRSDIFIGNSVRIYGRNVQIKEFANKFTRDVMEREMEHTFALIKPGNLDSLGSYVNEIHARKFKILRMRMRTMSRKEALDFYENRKGDVFLPFTIENMVTGPLIGIELVGRNAVKRWREEIGPTDPEEARKTHPNSLRAKYGKNISSNTFHGACGPVEAEKEVKFFFPERKTTEESTSAVKQSTTCCVIKPHVIMDGQLGNVIGDILQSNLLEITSLEMMYLNNWEMEEFLTVYSDVMSDFSALVNSFLNGPCLVMELSGKNEGVDAQKVFKDLCGPADPDVAKQIRPNSLRAKYGVDMYKNAVYCTLLPEDSEMEIDYFFKILD